MKDEIVSIISKNNSTFVIISKMAEKHRDEFYKSFNRNNTRNDFSQEKMDRYITILKNNSPKSSEDYYVLKKYVLSNDGVSLASSKDNDNDISKPIYVCTDQIYSFIKDAHDRTFHGGIKKTYRFVKKDARNIKMSHVRLYISLCSYCNHIKGRKGKKSNIVKSPIVSNNFGQRGQADLIDVKSFGQETCAYILNYQDNLTRFCILRPLSNKKAETVVDALTHIFNLIGAPKILHTDNGGEFRGKKFMSRLTRFWPHMLFVRGKPYNPRSQGAVERANRDIKNMILSYVNENDYDLLRVLSHIQYMKNISYNRNIKCSPYKALFGRDPPIVTKSEYIFPSIYKEEEDEDEEEDDEINSRQIDLEKNRIQIYSNLTLAAHKSIKEGND